MMNFKHPGLRTDHIPNSLESLVLNLQQKLSNDEFQTSRVTNRPYSECENSNKFETNAGSSSSLEKHCTPEQICSLHKAKFRTKPKSQRAKGKSAILKDTPGRNLLEQQYNKKLVSSATEKIIGGNQTKVYEYGTFSKAEVIFNDLSTHI
ncbi:hypothetical protein QE152_g3717 [Popillia japonica]|uniref:Uncharacterized protein n=1 Tax=Popillia japonica TaxID=7064 RepID=A0AAW1N208_POPJA